MQQIQGVAPSYPPEGTQSGVPDPPDGFQWADISYVIGGYTKKARFINQDGFLLTTGVDGVNSQWNLAFPPNGNNAGFVSVDSDLLESPPYDFSCFRCHTTGPLPQDADNPQFQENRPGFAGTWEEAGVQCESCHGPGSNHVSNPSARDLFVDNTGAESCNQCHSRPFDSQDGVILARDGFIRNYQQRTELLASGGHANFNCTFCHDPHRSVAYDRENAIRNECIVCHRDQNMALHEGKVFTRGNYTEVLTCESCHMPFATMSASAAAADVVGDEGRMSDTRTHIFRINTEQVGFAAMFTPDGGAVVQDSEGRASVTVDFVCLRCHNGIGAFDLSIDSAGDVALGMHGFP